MSDRDVTPPSEDDDGDGGLPFFWGFLVVAVVCAIALWLFSHADFEGTSETSATVLEAEDGIVFRLDVVVDMATQAVPATPTGPSANSWRTLSLITS